MLVRDYMSSKVVTVERGCPVADACALLRKHRIRQLPVLHKARLAGIVTDRDLRSASPSLHTVAEVMTAKPSVIRPDAPVDEAARILRALKVGALPVVEQHKLVGIVTTADVMDAFVELCGVTEPSYHMVLTGGDVTDSKWQVRRIIDDKRADLKWIYRDRRSGKMHLRLRATNIDDLVDALAAHGFEVSTIMSPARQPRPRRARG